METAILCSPPGRPIEVAPWLAGNTPEQAEIRSVESACDAAFPPAIPYIAKRNLAALHHASPHASFPSDFLTGWTRIPLEPSFSVSYPVVGPADCRFDKLSWRSGWTPESGYVAVGGIGKGNRKPYLSHAHHEANSILRMNLGGRIWVINNGYGRSGDPLPAAILFRTRQVGPEDHNTLVVRNPSSGAALTPPMNALLRDHGEEPIPFSLTELGGYGGVHWRRFLFVLPDIGYVVIDHATMEQADQKLPPLEVQWNLLGVPGEDHARLEQGGVSLELHHFGFAMATWKESRIAAWREAIRCGAYPHTKTMPNQWILTPRSSDRPEAWFVTGLWLTDSVASAEWDENARTLHLTPRAFRLRDHVVHRPWGHITTTKNALSIAIAP